VGYRKGKNPLGRPKCRLVDNVKIDIREDGGGKDWNDLSQDRDRWETHVSTVINLRVP
jgi:hypothetical protein